MSLIAGKLLSSYFIEKIFFPLSYERQFLVNRRIKEISNAIVLHDPLRFRRENL